VTHQAHCDYKLKRVVIFPPRYGNYEDILARMNEFEGGIQNMALGFKTLGCHVESDNTFVIREWAPGAQVRLLRNEN